MNHRRGAMRETISGRQPPRRGQRAGNLLLLVALTATCSLKLLMAIQTAHGLAIKSQDQSSPSSTSISSSSPDSAPTPTSSTPTTTTPGSPAAATSSGQHARQMRHRSSSSAAAAAAAAATRQSPASFATSLIGALGNMVPGLITNVAPLVLLFGLGALMMPALGLNAASVSRESRPSLIPAESYGTATPIQSASWPTFYYPNLQQTLFANAQQQHAQSVRQQPGLAQDFYYLTKRSLDGTGNLNQNHASYIQQPNLQSQGPSNQQQQQQSFNWPSSGQITSGLQTLLEHVSKAIENADKQYAATATAGVAQPAMANNNQHHQSQQVGPI